MTVIESILRDLNELPNPTLVAVASYVHSLNPKSKERRLAALHATAGCLDADEGELEILAAYDAGQLSLQDPSLQLREQIRTTAANTFNRKKGDKCLSPSLTPPASDLSPSPNGAT